MASLSYQQPGYSGAGLAANTAKQDRRLSASSLASLNLPENGTSRRDQRPPSPLRNGYTVNQATGELNGSDRDERESMSSLHDTSSVDRPWSQRSHSPTPSLSKFASNFAQRMNSLVTNINQAPRSAGALPSEAELEAEAEKARERSRREAERILMREEEDRRRVEEGVFALLDGPTHSSPRSLTQGLPPPPGRVQAPPSPSPSQKERDGGWFSAVKNKLTPSKDPLTPAQQLVQETKAKEKDGKRKNKDKDKEWPATPSGDRPAFLNPAPSASGPLTSPHRKPVPMPSSPESPTHAPRPISQAVHAMTPSPKHSFDTLSQDSQSPPLYAQFNSQGALDVPGTLLTIARRFEKLERWTVSHVRALEERMGDVERWLVDKEKEKDDRLDAADGGSSVAHDSAPREADMGEIREEMAELQGRVGALGREMAKLMTAPANLSSIPAARSPMVSAPSGSTAGSSAPSGTGASTLMTPQSAKPRSLPTVPAAISTSTSASAAQAQTQSQAPGRVKDASSPPPSSSSSILSTSSGRNRLPYPTGDYAPPGPNTPKQHDIFTTSPTNSSTSPPQSLEGARRRPMSIAGLPSTSSTASGFTGSSSAYSTKQSATAGLPAQPNATVKPTSPPGRVLSPPPLTHARPVRSSPSPTPRKRYTVALGGPLSAPLDNRNGNDTNGYSSGRDSDSDADNDGEEAGARGRAGHVREDTIGKSEERKSRNGTSITTSNGSGVRDSPRVRAQSVYGPMVGGGSFGSSSTSANTSGAPATLITPLKPRARALSSDRIGLGINTLANGTSTPSKFVDPLLLRRQTQERDAPKTPRTPKFGSFGGGPGKVPIGELVAFFDGDKR